MNCCVAPTPIMAVAGDIAIDFNVGVTVKLALPATDPELAVMVEVPAATAVASPPVTVATLVDEELHVAVEVRSCVLLSLYVPVAVNC